MVVPCGDGHMKVFSLIQQAVTRYRKAIAKVRGRGRAGAGGGGGGGGRGGEEGRRRDQYGASWKGEEGAGGEAGKGKVRRPGRASRAPPAPGCGPQSAPRGPGRRAEGGPPGPLRAGRGRLSLGAAPAAGAPGAARERSRAPRAGRSLPDACPRASRCRPLKSSPRPRPAPRPRGRRLGEGTFLVGEEFKYCTHDGEWPRFCSLQSLRPGGERGEARALSCLLPAGRGGPHAAGLPGRPQSAARGREGSPQGHPPPGSRAAVARRIAVTRRLRCGTPSQSTALESVTAFKFSGGDLGVHLSGTSSIWCRGCRARA